MKKQYIDPSASVSQKAKIGNNVYIWRLSQIREDAIIGDNCIIGMGVYIDHGVKIGSNVKIQNNVSIYHGVMVEDGVFVGPHVCFTNDKTPRAIDETGALLTESGWKVSESLVKKGASIGANATICPGVTIGEYAMIGAGSVVTKDVDDFKLVYGNPAKVQGTVDTSGQIVTKESSKN